MMPGPHLGRGPSSRVEKSEADPRDRDDERWPERDRDPRRHDPRDRDPRDVFMRDLDLPRGREREIVHDPRERGYTLRGSETRTLSTVGAFRVVPARDLRDHSGREADPRSGDLRHLREQGLVEHRSAGRPARRRGRADGPRPGPAWSPIEAATRTLARSSTRASNASGSSNTTRRSIAAYLSARSAWTNATHASNGSSWTTSSSASTSSGSTSAIGSATDYDGHPDRDAREIERMGARTRPAVLRRAGPFPRPADRIPGARRPPRSRGRRGGHHPLPRRPRRRGGAVGLHVATAAPARGSVVGVAAAEAAGATAGSPRSS